MKSLLKLWGKGQKWLEITNWNSILESLLFAAGDEGLSIKQLVEVLDVDEGRILDILAKLKKRI